MNDPFKILIDNERDSFDTLLPPPDMWARIDARMERPAPMLRFISPLRVVAAVAIMVVLSVAAFQLMQHRNVVPDHQTLSAIDQQVMEAARFYESQISHKQQQLIELTASQPAVREDVETDMAELDQALRELKTDLKDNIDNAEVLQAMIQTYRMKLDMLEQILSYLQPADNAPDNDSKTSNYEL